MSDYINRKDAIKAVFESHIHFSEHLRVTERIHAIPAADVIPAERLTDEGKLLLKYSPELINKLAAELTSRLDESVLHGADTRKDGEA